MEAHLANNEHPRWPAGDAPGVDVPGLTDAEPTEPSPLTGESNALLKSDSSPPQESKVGQSPTAERGQEDTNQVRNEGGGVPLTASQGEPMDASPGTGDSQAAVRLGEVIGWDRVAELARQSRESERRMAARRRSLRQAAGSAAVFKAQR